MTYLERVLEDVRRKDADQPEFIQAVTEVLSSMEAIIQNHPEYEAQAVLERLVESERIIQFKVPWVDDHDRIHVNRGFRVQCNSAIGPYKGGIRFNPSVNMSTMKFLAFEQTFKNALSGLPIGGAKGGSDFDPKGKSEAEIKRFCQSFMIELYRYIGPDVDVPAGDMGVGAKEIGYLYGQYRRLKAVSERGVLTGKGLSYGGSLVRKQATGYGLIYFVEEILKTQAKVLANQRVIVSGCGNVAIYATEKAQQCKAVVIGISDSKGYILDDCLDLEAIKNIKEERKGSLAEYCELTGQGTYHEGSIYDHRGLRVDIALPCATQNEIDQKRAMILKENGCWLLAEGANMPCSNEAIDYLHSQRIIHAPGKASNAGGVATSALEMSQNSLRLPWSFEEVDERLRSIMKGIHQQCIEAMALYGLKQHDYASAANIAGAQRVIEAMIAQGDY